MDVDDLEWQSRGLGGYPPVLVALLVEQGHVELLVRAAGRGVWSCARAAARELCERAEFERALDVLEPFVALGWEPARRATAGVLLKAGRVGQALDRFRPDDVGLASPHVCRDFAELLAKAGQVDEAIAVLTPHLDQAWMLSFLVELTEGQNRDERVLELLAPKAERARSARGEERWNLAASNAQELQAHVLERAGRVDEAVRGLGADIAAGRFLVENTLTAHAELLRRTGRVDELRELGTGEHAHVGLPYYARALEDRGRADEAETLLRRFVAADEGNRFRRPLIELLRRQGRIDEAVEVGRPAFYDHDACLLERVLHLLAEAGRFDDALAVLDERDAEYVDEHPSWFHTNRIWLLGEAGRYEEALAYAAGLPTDLYGLTNSTAWILERSGRVEEALGLLRADDQVEAWEVAALLVRHGRAEEAMEGMPSIAELRAAGRWSERSGRGR
ncbi:tetratricopeptide repeat protein [Streptomyces sp. UH6]|uniref:tetratricopeptide repeat protein n=1 Tax=Streptomyces sp. UH6 TaxID=2748379 RepID=UPI0015D4EF60|nr:tetratricopeptide repeat protein [Streptomyces sp. UH6]NYV74051.1 tetratricopeptide repeat protein [Streptomyces sp. UH6]